MLPNDSWWNDTPQQGRLNLYGDDEWFDLSEPAIGAALGAMAAARARKGESLHPVYLTLAGAWTAGLEQGRLRALALVDVGLGMAELPFGRRLVAAWRLLRGQALGERLPEPPELRQAKAWSPSTRRCVHGSRLAVTCSVCNASPIGK
jgi:hypothetical protein